MSQQQCPSLPIAQRSHHDDVATRNFLSDDVATRNFLSDDVADDEGSSSPALRAEPFTRATGGAHGARRGSSEAVLSAHGKRVHGKLPSPNVEAGAEVTANPATPRTSCYTGR
eukprot:354861-Chlamydomonas_euryale.AAC.18